MDTTTTTPATTPLPLTGSRRRILELLHHYRYLTPRQLAIAYGNGIAAPSSHVRHQLALLVQHSLVQRFYDSKRPRGQGSDQYIYTLSPAGGRRLLDGATYSAQRHKISRRSQRAQGNYDHHLALSDLQLILELGAKGWSVEQFRADERTPASRFSVPLDGKRHTVQPDVWATLRLDSGQRPLYLFEIDLERKNNKRTAQRFAAYASFLTSSESREMLKREGATWAAAVFVAPSEAERERLLEQAAITLKNWTRRERPQFFFWNLEDWHEQQRFKRREGVGTANERTREWVVTTLRKPAAIIAEKQLCDIHGKERWLVPLPS